MKKLFFLSIILAAVTLSVISCHKSTPVNNVTAIVGKWRYTGSVADTMIGGQWAQQESGYDSTIGPNFADSLQFTATDTVYYIYNGYTSWSNYKVTGNNLILIGNSGSDTLAIHSISDNALWVGEQTSSFYYWAGFTKYQ